MTTNDPTDVMSFQDLYDTDKANKPVIIIHDYKTGKLIPDEG